MDISMRYTYPAKLVEEASGFCVSFFDFEGVYTEADTFDEAIDMGAEALEMVVIHYIESGMPLPTPKLQKTGVAISVEIDTKDALISTKDAARLLNVNPSRVRQMIISGQLASKRQGRDNYVYLWSVKNRAASAHRAGRPRKDVITA
jgi:predicted RNase H-like HicB family nuclease